MIEWKPVIGYENEYLISNNGEIKSLPKRTRRGERFIKPQYTHGYAYVQLCKDKIITKKRIHRLVAEAFLENPEKLPQVNHKDHIRSNNHFSNLQFSFFIPIGLLPAPPRGPQTLRACGSVWLRRRSP